VTTITEGAQHRSVADLCWRADDHRVIRVLVAEDRADVRAFLTQLLDQSPDIDVVSDCADGDEVLPAAMRSGADVALLDLSMPRRSGLEAAKDLRAALPSVRVVILTGAIDAAAVCEAYEIGAVGYLLKSEDPDALADHVRSVAQGGTAWDPAALTVLHAAGVTLRDVENGDGPLHDR
jgi:DNA-binding NarL/FixJ family response regulator